MKEAGLEWKSVAYTDVGAVRKVNEDSILNTPEKGLWAVADGMGGHSAGDVASRMIVESLEKLPCLEKLSAMVNLIDDNVVAVNEALLNMAGVQGKRTIGSTVVVLVARGTYAVCLWAGDSRLYRLRKGVLEQLSVDHSEVEDLVARGLVSRKKAESHPSANVINRAVGGHYSLCLDAEFVSFERGDIYLLCSDGLYKEMGEAEIMAGMMEDDLETVGRFLVDGAIEGGGRDNISVVVIKIE